MKSKKVTFNMMAVNIEEPKNSELVVSDDIILEVKHLLDFKEAVDFVEHIVAICFDGNDIDYYPEVFDAAVRISTFMSYAGVDAPKDFSKAFTVVYGTDLFKRILALINPEQFNDLVDGAKRKIIFKRNLIQSNSAMKVNELLARIDEITEKSEKVMQNVDADKLVASMNNVIKEYGFDMPQDTEEGAE